MSATAKTSVGEEDTKKYRKFSRSHKPNRRFQLWQIQNESEWKITANLDIGGTKEEPQTQTAGFEALQEYISENYAEEPCAVVAKVKALEGEDKRPTDKMGVIVWIPDSCPARKRFVTSQSQAALANIVSAKAWNVSDLVKINYEDTLEMIGGSASSKKLQSADPETAAADDDDDDE